MDPSHRPRRKKKYKKYATKKPEDSQPKASEVTTPTTDLPLSDANGDKDSLRVQQAGLPDRPSEMSLASRASEANLDAATECASPVADESKLSIVVDVHGSLGFGRIQSQEDINSGSGEEDEGGKSDPEFVSPPQPDGGEDPDGVVIIVSPTAAVVDVPIENVEAESNQLNQEKSQQVNVFEIVINYLFLNSSLNLACEIARRIRRMCWNRRQTARTS